MLEIPKLTPVQEAKFWAKVSVGGPDECWPWTGAVTDQGMAKFSIRKRYYKAHRVVAALDGREPADRQAIRTCGSTICCNPRHIVLGGVDENSAIARKTGRYATCQSGARNPMAKLTDDQVSEIKARIIAGETNLDIAEDFPVSHSMVSLIRRGKAWNLAGTFSIQRDPAIQQGVAK